MILQFNYDICRYIEDYDGMTKYFAAFHLHKTFPAAIIIDDFEDHFIDRTCKQRYGNGRGQDLAMARCLALCRDAILHANQILEAQASCKLLFADTHQGDNPRLLFIYKRWVHCILTIHGDVHGFFILKNSNILSNALETRRAKYSISLQSLMLEAILENPAKNDKQSCALFSVHHWPLFSKDPRLPPGNATPTTWSSNYHGRLLCSFLVLFKILARMFHANRATYCI